MQIAVFYLQQMKLPPASVLRISHSPQSQPRRNRPYPISSSYWMRRNYPKATARLNNPNLPYSPHPDTRNPRESIPNSAADNQPHQHTSANNHLSHWPFHS